MKCELSFRALTAARHKHDRFPQSPTVHILTAALSHKDIWCVWSAFALVIYNWVKGVN